MADPQIEYDEDTETDTEEETALEPLYRVLIHNDDVTPMDFVVTVLTGIFKLSRIEAVEVMLIAHTNGTAVVQVLPKDEAQRRIGRAQFSAGLEGYPLKFTMEPE